MAILCMVFGCPAGQTLQFTPVDGGTDRACRGPGPSDSPSYYEVDLSIVSLDECKALCTNMNLSVCTGIEYSLVFQRCEVWISPIDMAIPEVGFECYRAESLTTSTSTPASVTRTSASTSSTVSLSSSISSTTLTTVDAIVWPTTTTATLPPNFTSSSTTFTTVDVVAKPTSTTTGTGMVNAPPSAIITSSTLTPSTSSSVLSSTTATRSSSSSSTSTTTASITSISTVTSTGTSSNTTTSRTTISTTLSIASNTASSRASDTTITTTRSTTSTTASSQTSTTARTTASVTASAAVSTTASSKTSTHTLSSSTVTAAVSSTAPGDMSSTTTSSRNTQPASQIEVTSTTTVVSLQSVTLSTVTATRTNTLTSSSTTSRAVALVSSAVAHMQSLEDREAHVLETVLSGKAPLAKAQVGGETILAQELTPKSLEDGELRVELEDSETSVTVPASFLEAVGDEGVLVVSVLDAEMALPVRDRQSKDGVRGAVSIRAASAASSGWVQVKHLVEPIRFTLPLESGEAAYCAYWDEEDEIWSDKGMETLGTDEKGHLVCTSLHLTLFGAILKGFVSALMCSQANLLSEKGLRAIVQSYWFLRADAILLWIVLTLEVSLLLTAFYLDARRRQEGYWSDEHFLTKHYLRTVEATMHVRSTTVAFAGQQAQSMVQDTGAAATTGCCASTKETVMNILDCIGSTLHASFGHLRNFVVCAYDALCELLVPPEDGKKQFTVLRRLLTRLLATSIQHQACASLWMSREDVRFLAEERRRDISQDIEVGGRAPGLKRLKSTYTGGRTPTNAWQDNFGRASSMALDHVSGLQQVVGEGLDRQHSQLFQRRFCLWPTAAWALFRSQAPCLKVLHYSIFMPASLGTLLLICRTLGALAVTALFFQTTGAVSVESSALCTSEGENVWNSLGECIAVALVTVILAAIPEMLLARLHTREFKHFEAEDLPERKEQLRIWQRNDRCLWTLCIAYMSCCLLFVMSFLANVTPEDALEWELSASIEILTELVFVPAAMSLLFLCVIGVSARWKDVLIASGEQIGCLMNERQEQATKPRGAHVPVEGNVTRGTVSPAEGLGLPALLRALDNAQQEIKRTNSDASVQKIKSLHSEDDDFLQ
eukprot:TRINITY_DN7444_c0_g1_i4.p1 TRINITY_DN7444_c0_g1~~TRINITY_DN7444_c0_g1_i4.p1  ORF type:complete len:1138 (-),score=180.24 TRINITY_DN7444_c0_g1_i4:167-3511(-)